MIIQMLKNKEVLQDTSLLSNRYDNKSTDIKINLVDEFVNENYFYYLICKSPDKNVPQFAIPLVLNLETKSLTYLVSNNITNTKGNWEFCLLIKEIEIVDGVINDDGLIAISEHFVGEVKSGIITEVELGEQPMEENLQIIYDILLATNANISANEEARQIFEPFDIGKSYVVGNKVSYLGSSYYCIADCVGILPTDTSKWLLIAKKGDKGDTGDTGNGLEFNWNGTQLGIRIEGETDYTYVNLKGDKGDTGNTGKSLEFTWNGTQLGIRQEGDATYQYVNLKGDKGDTGDTGKGLEFNWNGTQLGIRQEGDATYQYVNLKGDKGNQGDTGNGISSIVKTSGTGAAGTTDTYTITFTDSTTTTFQVYNGADGLGVGDMLKSVYDKDNSGQVDKADDADKFGGQSPEYYAKQEDLTAKKTVRFVVGTSTSGWTEKDCDYLCDGIADDVEINDAIQALPATGGEVVILDGTYNITDKISVTKNNVSIRGNGNATILKRMFDSSIGEGVITLTGRSGCKIADLQVDGNKASYTDGNNYGIYLNGSNNNTVTGNTCNNNSKGIYLNYSKNNTVTSNTCNNNTNSGIYLNDSSNNTITGNTCIRGTGQTSDYASDQHTILLSGTSNDYNLISNNNCMGKAPVVEGGTGNTIIDNKWSNSSGRILESYSEKLVTLSGTSTAINLSLGNVFTHTLSGNTTYTITNAVSGQAHSFTLIINMGSTVRTLTFPASVKWQGGEIPDMSTANKTYVLTFMTVDGGTTWLGMFGGEF